MATEREKMLECEVKRRRVRVGGGYEPFWKVKHVAVALVDHDTEFRCKDCHGVVKVLGKTSKLGEPAYVEHKHASDAAYCVSGLAFQRATDGRVSRWAENRVGMVMTKPVVAPSVGTLAQNVAHTVGGAGQ